MTSEVFWLFVRDLAFVAAWFCFIYTYKQTPSSKWPFFTRHDGVHWIGMICFLVVFWLSR